MNRRAFVVAGILLSMVPFTLQVGSFVLYYAVFGYGLLLLTFLLEPQGRFDWVLIFIAAMAVVSLLFQASEYYYPLHFAFQAAVAGSALVREGRKFVSVAATLSLAIFPVLTAVFVLVYLQVLPDTPARQIASAVYPLLSVLIVLFENKNGRLKISVS